MAVERIKEEVQSRQVGGCVAAERIKEEVQSRQVGGCVAVERIKEEAQSRQVGGCVAVERIKEEEQSGQVQHKSRLRGRRTWVPREVERESMARMTQPSDHTSACARPPTPVARPLARSQLAHRTGTFRRVYKGLKFFFFTRD